MQIDRLIVHVDMDAFFAAIEERDNPSLRGKPIVVGADPKGGKGRGVVSTCSYEARKFGIHSAMPISIAFKRCPEAVFLPGNMRKYSEVSERIYQLFYEFTPHIEPISIDEAFLDITTTYHLFGSPLDTCRLIKDRIKNETLLTASIGIAPTMMAAKIASDLKKPDGLVEVTRDKLLDFLWPLSVDRMLGVGKKTKASLEAMGIGTIGDLAKRDIEELAAQLGKSGVYFWRMANGIDEREVENDHETKSVSNEFTFEEDTYDEGKIRFALLELCEKVSSRMRQEGLKGRTISLKIRLDRFDTYSRAVTIDKATNFFDVVHGEIQSLYNDFKKEKRKVRLLGVKASNLSSADFPDSLFMEKEDLAKVRVHKAIDKIRGKFGEKAIYRQEV